MQVGTRPLEIMLFEFLVRNLRAKQGLPQMKTEIFTVLQPERQNVYTGIISLLSLQCNMGAQLLWYL